MATYSKMALSGSANGRGIKVAAIATPGTTIHTAVAGASNFDEIWIYAFNAHSAQVNLTLEWGGTDAPDDNIQVGIPNGSGLCLVAPGLLLQDSLVLKAFAGVANLIVIYGFVNRITA